MVQVVPQPVGTVRRGADHGHASEFELAERGEAEALTVVGGGTGLIGLKDRVEALAGRLDIVGPPEGGTRLIATIPVGAEPLGP